MAFTPAPHEHHYTARFDSGDVILDRWLRENALQAGEMNTGHTFVWHSGDRVVVAYVVMPHMVARESLTKHTGCDSPNVIPAILLARLALERSEQGQGLGEELLWDAISEPLPPIARPRRGSSPWTRY